MKKQFVESLQEGDVVNDYFVATRKDLRDTQSGGKFLGLVFKDRTGEVGGILWNNAAAVAERFELGDVVSVRGSVTTYQSRLQVRVDQILPMKSDEYAPADLVFEPEGMDEVLAKLTAILDTVENEVLSQLVRAVLDDDEIMSAFKGCAAGKKWHHAHAGGLMLHCYEMARLADTACELFPIVDRDLLLTGILLHDIGKVEEMTRDLHIEYTTAGKLVGHLQLGCFIAESKMSAIPDFPETFRLQILHMILSHHGEMNFGSPVVPKTVEAMVLYLVDNLSAQTNAFGRITEETNALRQEWSPYIPLIERQIWTRNIDR